MSNAIPIIAIFIGGVIAFAGYRIFVDVPRLWAFLVAGVCGAYFTSFVFPVPGGNFLALLTNLLSAPLTGSSIQITLPLALGFLLFGILGAVFAHPIRPLIVFLTGAALGMLVGTTGYQLVFKQQSILLAIILAIVVGALAVKWEDLVMIVSTSFVGAAAVAWGMLQLNFLEQLFPNLANPEIPIAAGFFAISFLGVWLQYKDAHMD